ncbi:Phosphoglycerate mutase domain protein, partial [mine drainage metagenome]
AVLVRHGESEANILRILDDDVNAKYHLTDTGKGQVQYALTQLKKLKLELVVSSPILRARETAEILAESLGLSVEVDPDLKEAGQGTFSQNGYDQLPPLYRNFTGQESWDAIVDRMLRALERHEGNCIAVSHALPIRCLLSSYMGIKDEASAFGIQVETASMSCVDVSERKVLSAGSYVISNSVSRRFS